MSIYLPIAGEAISLWVLLGAGIIVGGVAGIFGIGGGVLITPILIIYGVPTSIAAATGASLVVASAATALPKHIEKRTLDFKLAFYLICFGFLGSMVGIWLFGYWRSVGKLDHIVGLIYVVLLGTISIWMFIESLWAMRKKDDEIHKINTFFSLPLQRYFSSADMNISLLSLGITGTLIGMLSAIMGIGGNTVLIPILIYLFQVPMRIVIGTSTLQVCCVAIFTVLLQAIYNNTIDIVLAFFLIIGGVIGAYYGQILGQKIKAKQLRFLFSVMILSMAIKLGINIFMKYQNAVELQQPIQNGSEIILPFSTSIVYWNQHDGIIIGLVTILMAISLSFSIRFILQKISLFGYR